MMRARLRIACLVAVICVGANLALTGASGAAPPLSSGNPVLFGDQNVESGNDSDGSRTGEAFPFLNGTTGTAQSITVYITKQQALSVALYSSTGSKPGSLMASGSLTPTGTGWQTVTIPSTSVTAGATYWIALLGPVSYRDGSKSGCSSYSASMSSFSSTFPSGAAWQSCPLSAYVSGTTTAPPPPAAPSYTSPPTITGVAQQGQTLTASSGAWTGNPTSYSYRWSDGAQGATDTLPATDIGQLITVTVTATNAGGSNTATSAAVGPVTALPAPQSTSPPTITGVAQQGQTLTASSGAWTGNPTSYSYQWQDCNSSGTGCGNIAASTNSASYTIAPSDIGYTIVVVVTATNGVGSTSQASAPTATVSAGSTYSFGDEFSGSSVDLTQWDALDQQGDTSNSEIQCYLPSQTTESGGYLSETAAYVSAGFTCPTGTPLSTNPLNYESGAIQMKSANFTYGTVVIRAKVSGGTRSTWPAIWLLGAACETSSLAPYTWLSGTSATPTGYYCPWSADSADAAEIDIEEYGNTTTPNENVYNNSGNVTSDCTYNLGANVSSGYHTYELDWSARSLVFKVDGITTHCGVTGSGVPSHPMFLIINTSVCTPNVCGTPSPSQLPQVTSVDYVHITSATMPVNTSSPTISGTPQVGNTLTAGNGSWTNSPSSYTYTWQQDRTTVIPGATGSTYTPVAGDSGHTLNCIVTAKNASGAGAQSSASTATVS